MPAFSRTARGRVGAGAGGVGHAGEVQHGVAARDEVARGGVAGVELR